MAVDRDLLGERAELVVQQLQVATLLLPHHEHPVGVAGVRRGSLELAGRVADRRHAQAAAVAGAGDADVRAIDPVLRAQPVGAGDCVLEIAVTPVAVVQILKLLAVARAAADVWLQHRVAVLGQVLRQRVEHVVELAGWAAVDKQHCRAARAGLLARRPVQVGVDRQPIEGWVGNLLRLAEPPAQAHRQRVSQPRGRAAGHVDGP